MDALRVLADYSCAEEGILTGKEDSSTWAREMLSLLRCADIFDVGERKVEHCDLDEAGESCGDNLGHEHRSGRNLVGSVAIRYDVLHTELTFM